MSHVLSELIKYSSTWEGHVKFAKWLAAQWDYPEIIDLGVDYGLSTFSFALGNRCAKVTGIDCFEGDPQSGFRDTQQVVNDFKTKHGLSKVNFIKGYFDDVAPHTSYCSADIIHIDGLHTYEAVKHDFNTWLPILKHDGVILMHDTRAYKPGFGVRKFFSEIDMPKLNFSDSYGLGVVCRNPEMIDKIYDKFSDKIDYLYYPGTK
jgi:SAM-dependent methyltransferase